MVFSSYPLQPRTVLFEFPVPFGEHLIEGPARSNDRVTINHARLDFLLDGGERLGNDVQARVEFCGSVSGARMLELQHQFGDHVERGPQSLELELQVLVIGPKGLQLVTGGARATAHVHGGLASEAVLNGGGLRSVAQRGAECCALSKWRRCADRPARNNLCRQVTARQQTEG